MKIVVTGSLGNISKPLTENLLAQGHQVTLISTNPDKQDAIRQLGATPAIGSIGDLDFLVNTFTGADAVYCMNPLDFTAQDLSGLEKNNENYIKAIKETGVPRVVALTGWVAHLLSSQMEQKWHTLPENTGVTILRPGSFYSNFYGMKDMIRNMGCIVSNYGGEDMVAFVAPEDIADAAAEELLTPLTGVKIRYAASEELTCNQAAAILGEAIGKPDLQWNVIPGEQLQQHMESMGISKPLASLLVEMQAHTHNGNAQKDYYLNRPVLGRRKLREFAKGWAAWYNNN
jgi:NAD(P)H dehydrogenase (quinone)